jgi:hypothetical protein
MGRWLELFRGAKNQWDRPPDRRCFTATHGAGVIDFLTPGIVHHDISSSVIGGGFGFLDILSPTEAEWNAATLARWILKERPHEVHVRTLLRKTRLPGLRSAGQVKAAAKILVEANWLRAPVIGFGARSKAVYAVNPRLWGR